jgi:ATP-dependent protease ClpP protease subunit
MKYLVAALAFLLFSLPASAVEIKQAGLALRTKKVAHISGPIEEGSYEAYAKEVKETLFIPGVRVLLINSPGGLVKEGQKIIELMRMEKALGTQFVCVAMGNAHSMAFNILTECDTRLAVEGSTMVVHKVRAFLFGTMRSTDLKKIAALMDKIDEPYRQSNSKAMRLSLKDYDKFADAETRWTVPQLLGRGYLDGIVTVSP